ncbi:hypothetical protein BUE80_DR007405, partial [Diplocarpon rosae]
FTNPWSGSTPSPNHSLYAPSHTIHPSLGLDIKHAQQHQHHASRMNSTSSVGSYAGISLGAASSAGSPLMADPSVPSNSFPDDTQRSHRQHSLADFDERGLQNEAPRSFGDAIDASRGMIAMSQTTPRNIYEAQVGRVRGSGDAYGFPTTHSSSSSISSSSNYATYYGSGSVESSVSDYSNASSDIESVSSRTLPRPSVEGCGRHFSVVSNLRRHRKVHKGEARSDAGSEDHHSDD